ncbi:MAG: DUF2017 family protein [Acidimicrobiales bacterium]
MIRSRLRRGRDGSWQLRLPAAERDLLRSLPSQVRQLIAVGDDATRRLFPPAYADDPVGEAEYRQMVGNSILASHTEALRIMESTVDAEVLDDTELNAWLGALNDLRLVIGTRLDVDEGFAPLPPGDPLAPAMATYSYLSALQEQVVIALTSALEGPSSK